jgi:hypothetical protein
MRQVTRWVFVGILLLATRLEAAEPLAVLTELSFGTGAVHVRRADDADWIGAQPLLALRPGDQIRVTGNAQAVVLFSGGSVQKVGAASSPFTVQPPRGRSGRENVQSLLGGVVHFLLGQQKDPRFEQLSVRGPSLAPRIVSPRETRLLPGAVTFEWSGSAVLRYHVKLAGPEGVVWERDGLPRQALPYPASAPALRPGTRYTWSLIAPGQAVQQASFDVVSTTEAERIQQALAELRRESLPEFPANTLLVMRAGLLMRERLYGEARRELLAGLAADPSVSTLRQMLGHVYEKTGLDDLAILEYEEATMLARPRS